jgi:2-hydroxy-6-oxonona-2,4-dienedioate hydrolase
MDSLQANQHITHLDHLAEHRSVPFAPGRVMRWRLFGKGEPLVLVHGGHGSWMHWVRNIEVLARDHQVLVPDLPSFGDSDDLPPVADSAEGMQAIVAALITSMDAVLGGRSVVDLVGFSYGGVVSAHVAAQRGAVRRLALLGSPGSATPSRRKGEMMRWRNADEAAQNAALRHNLLTHMMYADSNVDALAFRVYADTVKAARYRGRGGAHRVPLNDILATYRRPVLFLYGEHDVICTPAMAQQSLMNAKAGRECHIIPGSGHWVPFEGAAATNEHLLRWLHGKMATQAAPPLAVTV